MYCLHACVTECAWTNGGCLSHWRHPSFFLYFFLIFFFICTLGEVYALDFTGMPGESHLSPFWSLLLCPLSYSDVYRALLIPLVCWYSASAQGKVPMTRFPLAPILCFRLSPRAHIHVVGMLGFVSVDINQSSLPTPLYSALGICFCHYGPFNCILFLKFSRSPDIIPSGWLGSKHQLIN